MSTLMTDDELARVLKGTRVVVFVSEPFGFEYPGEERGLRARVSGARTGVPGGEIPQSVDLELETPFVAPEGVKVSRLTARMRHEIEAGIIEQLAKGEHVSANLSYADQVPDAARLPGRVPKLIGGMNLAD